MGYIAPKLRALIVEQDADMLSCVASALGNHFYDVTNCGDIEAAQSHLKREQFHLVLVSTQFGVDMAWSFCRQTRKTYGDGLCLLVVVADSMDELMPALQAGADDFLTRNTTDLRARVTIVAQRAVNRRSWAYAQRELRASEERFALAAKAANDGIWDWDLVAGRIYLSDVWREMLGYADEDLSDSPDEWLERVHPKDREDVKKDLNAHLQGDSTRFDSEHRVLHADGRWRWMNCRAVAVFDDDGKPLRIVGTQMDITARRAAEDQMYHNTFHDSLTNLPNRALIVDRISCALERTRRSQNYMFAVLYLNMDRFKLVIDSLGHDTGDRLLCDVAARLQHCMRSGDTVGRSSGDEFIVLVDDMTDPSDGVRVAERIQSQLTRPFQVEGQEVFINVNIGIALSNRGYTRAASILRDADTAMHRAKDNVNLRHAVFDTAMHERAVTRLQLETDLRRAITRDEFRLHYQPLVDMHTEKIIGFEALIRWQHPTRGLLSPAEFLEVAEETGMILPMGYWVIREACEQLKKWNDYFCTPEPLAVSINLSCKQFADASLAQEIDKILSETGMDPNYVWLEITESVVMEHAQQATNMLNQLKKRGVQVCLDDFGTGHCTLSYLHQLPIDTLKIDRSFVSGLGDTSDDAEIVKVITSLAEHFGLSVVAEGIETRSQMNELRSLNGRIGQGYYFSRPLPSGDVESMWRGEPTRFGVAAEVN